MIVLAVDTGSAQGSLAVLREGSSPEVVVLPPGQHSTTLHREIIRLLEQCHLRLSDITGYAVTTGPGPFTAVRVGLTAVKGLAEAQGKAVVAISTLETVARAAVWTAGLALPVTLAPVLDARRGQIFGAVYQCENNGWRLRLEETVCSLDTFLRRLQEASFQSLYFCGTEMERFAPQMEKEGWSWSVLIAVSPHLAGVAARIALERLQKGQGISDAAVDANYGRPSDAELFFGKT
ncbi:MAG: tRNA (adenosine(37)-N6)-threonylcarbamoyltransferase complex dimerization subunit type 1 TsaB [Acidobacteria bacterium]|nr:tRNA (adenosine(37)-N6)-threonylcarbamoyltransferase complex dimerization subunit type 1 TsaB [Acidobacteriota bacterium]